MRKNIPDEFVDLTVTSPPYDNLRKYKGFIFDYQSMIKELYRVTKDGGVVVWVVGDATIKGSETGTSFKHALYAKEIGFNLHDTMIYAKNNPIPQNHNRYEQQFEYMFVFSKGKPKTFNPLKIKTKTVGKEYNWKDTNDYGSTSAKRSRDEISIVKKEKNMFNIWFMNVASSKYTNSAPFPKVLANDHILSWSNERDIILDPMCGAGTTCKMAWLNNRKFIGIDMSKEYINEICIPRLEMYGWKQNNNISFNKL
jgi:site-specific DNA-methyltransferase (adenine-specific)